MPIPVLRIARPSDDIDALLPFYRDGLGLTVLYRFEDHDGFDGVMLGYEKAPYHFEFTRARGHAAGRAPTADNLVVFYLPDAGEWQTAVERMRAAGFAPVAGSTPIGTATGSLSRTRTAIGLCCSGRPGPASAAPCVPGSRRPHCSQTRPRFEALWNRC